MSEKEKLLSLNCPNCKEELTIELPKVVAPVVRSLLTPIGNILVYRISSNEIKQFIKEKAKFFKAEVMTEVITKYCEKKNSNPHKGYASLRIAFSDVVIDKKGSGGWYQQIGESSDNVRFVQDLFVEMVKKYSYNGEELETILNNYKKLETVENRLGMTEAFIEDIKMYITPKRVMLNNNNESWIIYSARAEKVIEDMLESTTTDKVEGTIEIHDVHPITKDVIEFIVYVHPQQMKSKDNPYVRKLMLGEK